MSITTLATIAGLMFLLELPDKTMIATVVMSTRARASSVAIGASLGFVAQMALAVAAGQLLTLLPHRPKAIIVALLFLAGAAYLLFVTEKEETAEGEREGASEYPSTRAREIMTACSVIFIGEFGDLTQIQAANFAAKYHAPVEIFLICSLAMIAVACLGAFGGRALQRVVPLEKIRLAGGVVFAVLGLWTLVQAL